MLDDPIIITEDLYLEAVFEIDAYDSHMNSLMVNSAKKH